MLSYQHLIIDIEYTIVYTNYVRLIDRSAVTAKVSIDTFTPLPSVNLKLTNNKYMKCKNEKDFPELQHQGEVTKAPDPFRSEIHNDHTDVWMCERCREQSRLDI